MDLIGGAGEHVASDWCSGNLPGLARPLAGCQSYSAFLRVVSVGGRIMVDIMELPKARVNASMLTQYIDRPVCFLGRLEKVRVGSGERTGPLGNGCGVGSGDWEQVTFKQHCPPACFSFHKKSFSTSKPLQLHFGAASFMSQKLFRMIF